jgi:predicted NUDIX family NTP pyrophosphohydrolase
MSKQSAGILLYRIKNKEPEFFIVHPGGPFWANKDEGAWSIPKGEFAENEKPLDAAIREFYEETGFEIEGKFIELNPVKLKSGKIVLVWGLERDIDPEKVKCHSFFTVEWPPKSGRQKEFPEIDRSGWFSKEIVKKKLNPAQNPLIEEIITKICENS